MIDSTRIENKLKNLSIPGRVVSVSENAFFIDYKVRFSDDITLNRIKSRLDDIAFFLDSPVSMETESGVVIFKAQKSSRDLVGLYDFTVDLSNGIKNQELPVVIGLKEDGSRLYYDLVKMPHLLVGGSTGSGKSVFIHNTILSMIYTGKSNIMLIDVKRVEFSIYEGIPHLCHKIAYTPTEGLKALQDLDSEMTRRYEELKKAKCRNILEYRGKGGKMNYICLFIDELADLMLTNKKTEFYLIRLAQLGRAAGIHLILATQRPDSTVVSGLIRANIPSRVCFAVQKATDSRIILDLKGGESLKGNGDGLFLPIGSKTPTRFQSPYISTEGLTKAVDLIKHCND